MQENDASKQMIIFFRRLLNVFNSSSDVQIPFPAWQWSLWTKDDLTTFFLGQATILQTGFESFTLKMIATPPRGQWVHDGNLHKLGIVYSMASSALVKSFSNISWVS